MAKYMFIVAHPDDEVLGAGGLIQRIKHEGGEVAIIIVAGGETKSRPNMVEDMRASHEAIGITPDEVVYLSHENLALKTILSSEIVPQLEGIIKEFQPDYIYTHWEGDIHPDHKAVAEFSKQAARYTQRHNADFSIKGLYAMEIPSSTDWGNAFIPEVYSETSEEWERLKIKSLSVYENVLREDTHPRSARALIAHSVLRGSEIGKPYAEAFKVYWEVRELNA